MYINSRHALFIHNSCDDMITYDDILLQGLGVEQQEKSYVKLSDYNKQTLSYFELRLTTHIETIENVLTYFIILNARPIIMYVTGF